MKSIKQSINIKTEDIIDFPSLIYLPENYNTDVKNQWPVILYLHGKDERGTDCTILKNGGLPKYIENNAIPFIVIAPQCPTDSEWIFHLDALTLLVKEITKEYNADTRRIYLTGLSMGGIGAWHLGIKYPSMFAAIIPICGGTYPFLGYPDAVIKLKDVPVWAFHGMDDDVLPIRLTQVLVDNLLKINGKVKYTYYKNTGHDAWTKTYSNKEVYEWLLQHAKE